MHKLLFSEHVGEKPSIVESTITSKGKYYIEGVFAQTNVLNRNMRIYPKQVFAPALEKYNEQYVMKHRAMGELNHPDNTYVNPKEACIKIEKLEFDGDDVIGRALVMDTPNGKTVKAIMDAGVQIGVSTRGLGKAEIREETEDLPKHEEITDYELVTVDVVTDPSAPDAYVNGICERFLRDHSAVKEQNDRIVEYIVKYLIGD